MNDNNIVGLIMVAVCAFFICGLALGTKLENSRLYDSCMRENENVIHAEATKLCTERTK